MTCQWQLPVWAHLACYTTTSQWPPTHAHPAYCMTTCQWPPTWVHTTVHCWNISIFICRYLHKHWVHRTIPYLSLLSDLLSILQALTYSLTHTNLHHQCHEHPSCSWQGWTAEWNTPAEHTCWVLLQFCSLIVISFFWLVPFAWSHREVMFPFKICLIFSSLALTCSPFGHCPFSYHMTPLSWILSLCSYLSHDGGVSPFFHSLPFTSFPLWDVTLLGLCAILK